MKRVITFILLCMFSFQYVNAQIELLGKWTSECHMNSVDGSNYIFTKLCHIEMDLDNDTSYVLNFNMKISLDSITFNFSDESRTLPYYYDSKSNKVSFILDGEKFRFYVSWIQRGKSCTWIEDRKWVLILNKVE